MRTTPSLTVAQAVALLRDNAAHAGEIDGIVLVDETGAAIDEISLFELLLADPRPRRAGAGQPASC